MSNTLETPLQQDARESRCSFHRPFEPLELETPKLSNPTIFQHLEAKYPSSIAYYYMILSALFMSSNAVCAKLLYEIPAFELLSYRSILLMVFLAIYIIYFDNTVMINDRKNRKLIFMQSFLAFILGYCYFYGIKYMPLSEAIVLMYTNPMFTGFLAWVLVKEYYPLYERLSALTSVIGVVLIMRPEFIFGGKDIDIPDNESSEIKDVQEHASTGLVCLAVSFLLSLNGVFIKLTGKAVHPITLVWFGVFFSTILAPLACLIFEGFVGLSWFQALEVVLMAVFNFFGQFFLTKSYQMSEKTIGITLVNYIQIFFAYIFDLAIIHDVPNGFSVLGSVLIVFGCLYILIKLRK